MQRAAVYQSCDTLHAVCIKSSRYIWSVPDRLVSCPAPVAPQDAWQASCCANLLAAMMSPDPADRPTPAEIFRHPFFDGFDWVALQRGEMRNPLLTL